MNAFVPLRYVFPLTLAAVLAACNTMPQRDAALEDARAAHDAAARDPNVRNYAALEYQRADDEFRRAETTWMNRESRAEVDHRAYLAQRRAEIALETGELKASEAAIANATAERERARLEARTREAAIARQQAQVATLQAEATLQQAADAQRQAELAAQQAQAAQAEAMASRQRAQETEARNQALASQLADLQAKMTERGLVITLGDVLFDTGSARLREPGVRAVGKLAAFMQQYPQRTVAIEGFTDSVGSEPLNQELSERRADAIHNALVDDGISANRITTRGYGKAFPVASNNDSTGRQLNRRVEVVISDDSGHMPPARLAGG